MIMKKFEVIWVISLFIILLLGINYLVSGQNRISNFIFGIFCKPSPLYNLLLEECVLKVSLLSFFQLDC